MESPQPIAPAFELGRRELLILLGFLVTVVALDLALRSSKYKVMVPYVHAANQIQLLAHRLREQPEDVLILGSSRVKEGIDPNVITNMLAFSEETKGVAVKIPYQGMRAWTLEQLVRDVVVPAPPERMLVIGLEERFFFVPPHETDANLDMRMLADPGDLFAVDWRHASLEQLAELSMAPLHGIQAPWSLLRLLDPRVKQYVALLHETRGEPTEDFKDLSRTDFLTAKALAERIKVRAATYQGEQLRPLELDSFRKTLDLLERMPFQTVFVRLAVLPEFDAGQSNELALFHQIVVPMVRERGFAFYDMNEVPELRLPELFENPSHLGRDGQRKASLWLGRFVIMAELVRQVPGQSKSE